MRKVHKQSKNLNSRSYNHNLPYIYHSSSEKIKNINHKILNKSKKFPLVVKSCNF